MVRVPRAEDNQELSYWPRPRLERRVVCSGIALILVLALIMFFDVMHHYDEAERNAHQTAINLVHVLSSQTEGALSSIDLSLLNIIDAVRGREVAALTDAATHRFMRGITNHLPYMRAIYILDSSGNVVQTSRDNLYTPFNVADREYFIYHHDHPEPVLFIGPPVVGRATAQASITLSRRLDDAKGDFAGVVLGIL